MIESNYSKRGFGVFVRQRRKITVRTVVAFAALLSTLLFTQSGVVNAQGAANTLKVTPVRSDIEIMPGDTKTVKVTVSNLTKNAINIHPIANDFIAGDDNGTPALILDEKEFAASHSLKRFMSPLEDILIPAEEAKTINVTISVPKEAQAGGYYGAIRFAPTVADSGGQVNLSASVASLILLRVPGETVEKLSLREFTVLQSGTTGSFFRNNNDMKVAFSFDNLGNVHVGPFGKISIKKGDKVVHEYDFNVDDPRSVILPDSTRRWDVPLEKVDTAGHYTVIATFTYGQRNQTIEVEQSFWFIPDWVIIVAIAGVIVLVGIVILVIFLIRKRSRRSRAPRGRYGHR